MIFDATKLESVNVIEAHQAPLSCVALNHEGTLLATASEKGTIVRVFSIPDAQKLFQFRRGSIPARILSMSFNSTSTLLCVSSATETVHIFRLTPQTGSRSNSISSPQGSSIPSETSGAPSVEDSGTNTEYETSEADISGTSERRQINPTFASRIRRTSQNVSKTFAATVGGYLPTAVAEIWEPTRDFAWVKVPKSLSGSVSLGSSSAPVKTVVALSNSGPQVMVVTSEGNFFVFNIDLEKGGEGTLVKQFS